MIPEYPSTNAMLGILSLIAGITGMVLVVISLCVAGVIP